MLDGPEIPGRLPLERLLAFGQKRLEYRHQGVFRLFSLPFPEYIGQHVGPHDLGPGHRPRIQVIITEEDYTLYHPSGESILDGGHLDHRPPVNPIVRLELELDNR